MYGMVKKSFYSISFSAYSNILKQMMFECIRFLDRVSAAIALPLSCTCVFIDLAIIIIGEMKGNIMAAIPVVQLAVNNAIAVGSYIIIAYIMSGLFFDIIHYN